MKKTIFIFGIVITIMQACQKKTLPTITTRTTEPAKPVTVPVDVKPDIAAGKTIFTNRCGRCHALPDPVQFTAQRWDVILKTMIPRARLDNEQGVHVKGYLLANTAK